MDKEAKIIDIFEWRKKKKRNNEIFCLSPN